MLGKLKIQNFELVFLKARCIVVVHLFIFYKCYQCFHVDHTFHSCIHQQSGGINDGNIAESSHSSSPLSSVDIESGAYTVIASDDGTTSLILDDMLTTTTQPLLKR